MINNDITHIYHLADLHVRNLHRHREYKLIFKKFLKQVKKDNIKNAVIYLAGDLAHTKTEMSPELIHELSLFMGACADLHDTIVITGNHDCNLNNNNRMDALTPIIENLNHPKLHYLRDTAVYPFKNLTFVPFSILDNKTNWPSGYDVGGENTIALFHGPVHKAQTDIGYEVSSNSFMVDMFDGYDMALLGDIHKRQDLQQFSESTIEITPDVLDSYISNGWKCIDTIQNGNLQMYIKKPIITYAGSMIQQNQGELLEKHGYLLWDVKSRTYEEFDIHNDFGFLTIDVIDGEIPQWVYDELGTKLPKHPRLRLRFSGTAASEMKKCVTELKKMFRVSEITITRMDTMGKLDSKNKLNKSIVGDVTDETFQSSLLREYLERRFMLEDADLNSIDEINKEINSRVDVTNNAHNVIWKPKIFEFSNMFSYGENNKVDLGKGDGIIGIFSPNASGKSSIFDALSFCIFDKSSRTNVSKNILNNRKDNFNCKFNFEIDSVDYYIERTAKWTRNKTNLKVDVNFWKVAGGVTESLNGEQRRDTNKNIEQYLGKFDDFILTTLSLQGNNALFIDKSQTERKEVLSQFIGVDVFDKLYQVASDENRDNSALIRKFKQDDFTTKLAEIETTLITDTVKYAELKSEQLVVSLDVDKYNTKIIELNSGIVKLNSDLIGRGEIIKRRNLLKDKLQHILLASETSQNRSYEIEEKQIEVDELLDTFDNDAITIGLIGLETHRTELTKCINEYDKSDIQYNALLERKKHLEAHKYNPECDICMENSESIISSKLVVDADILVIEKNMINQVSKIDKLKLKVAEYLKFELQYRHHREAQLQEERLDRELTIIIKDLSRYETDEIKLVEQIEQHKQLIIEWWANADQIKKNKEIRDKIEIERTLLAVNKRNLLTINGKVLSLNGKISTLTNQKDTIEERIREVKELEHQTKLYDYYLNALSKDGISYELIEKSLPMIEGEINNILSQIVEFGMQLEISGKNINAYLVYGDNRWSLEMSSGMERFISGIAIRVALINVCNLPRPNFLVIDEGFGTLDTENLQSLFVLFTYLKTQFDFVMIISHIESMRDVVDNLIEIKREDGFSYVKY